MNVLLLDHLVVIDRDHLVIVVIVLKKDPLDMR
jgi:hypothetical protein